MSCFLFLFLFLQIFKKGLGSVNIVVLLYWSHTLRVIQCLTFTNVQYCWQFCLRKCMMYRKSLEIHCLTWERHGNFPLLETADTRREVSQVVRSRQIRHPSNLYWLNPSAVNFGSDLFMRVITVLLLYCMCVCGRTPDWWLFDLFWPPLTSDLERPKK